MGSIFEIRDRRQDFMPLNFPVEDIHLIVQLPVMFNTCLKLGVVMDVFPYLTPHLQACGHPLRMFYDMPWIILKVVSGILARLFPTQIRRFFLNEVLWTDECQFSKQGNINTENKHYWSLEYPHLIRPNRHQVRWSVNVWCGIWKSTLIRPIYFDGSLTSESYTEILSRPLADFLEEEVSLRDLSRTWYQHDGAPAHKSAQTCTFLVQTFDTRIIGYGDQEVSEATGGVSDAGSVLQFCGRQSF
ncbi:uncharacterized protein TNCV_1357251 [Trichonephila clavipes]|uniref:Transposase n=1 Tax=Trichonephila clavipes TaxID=2585209 RepID=A0A8X6VIA1_TRICX|nr:uncharacterized protein TNCV_1357251 [Trichonephila clavipes]